jgi:serine/threonine-protein kinase
MASGRSEERRDQATEETVVPGETVAENCVTCSAETILSGDAAPQDAGPGIPVDAPPDTRYDDRGEIGRGGMGTVHRSFDRLLLRSVAMKLIESRHAASMNAVRFVEEAQITGQLDHPNIVPVYDFGRLADNRAYITMKLVTGQTLTEVIQELHRGGSASEAQERILGYVLKVCEAISFAHSRGVIHQDLKPANIMIGSHGQVYVMDWGLGRLRDGHRSPSGSQASEIAVSGGAGSATRGGLEGTIAYMAPEQALGRHDEIDHRTDVFALGAVLYEVLTCRPPYRGPVNEALARAAIADIDAPEQVGGNALPPGLCEIAMKAMRRDREERYQSVDELHAAVERFLRGGGWFATRRFQAGQVIVAEGDNADAAYVIVEGTCEVHRGNGAERQVLRTLGPGDVFGETALLSAKPRTATVTASEPVTLKVVTREAFDRELGHSAWLGALVRQLAQRFLELEREVRGPA